ncbi:response regulator transcription factor [Teredinibacter waterburyi]|uniref:response regulator transcription factor n=1 Tax=Teredinibacter waterburyi TaxID=1500538 RepID=UPI00165F0C1E|nr:response regulator [Teredinibacter waterburyi]
MSKLLYIEDDEVLAAVTTRAFTRRGFDVLHFASIGAFERYKKANGASGFEFGLLDLKLEDGVSLPLIETLLRESPAIKIVLLTGYASVATAVQAIKLGATNYLPKPATVDQIIQAFTEHEEAQDGELGSLSDDLAGPSLRRLEWEHIQQVLNENNGNISATARQLKMHRRTLQRKLGKRPVAE